MKSRIKELKKESNSLKNKREIKSLYDDLYNLQFKSDYICLIIDRPKDYHRARKGFTINGKSFKRLLGTNGGVKNNTIVFVSDVVSDELARRTDNGRQMDKEAIPAKLEAYKALTCSASIPVSTPKGILIVDDAETTFKADITYLSDTDLGEEEPEMTDIKDYEVTLNASDGFGLMLPSLAARWSEELGLDYTIGGANTRFSFEKGMAVAFDFIEFSEMIAKNYLVKDAWGDIVDIRNVELILTTSMVKLWDSYSSCDDYVQTSLNNKFTFGISKVCPEHLESERCLNYQFIQSYDLDDDDIEELIKPMIDEFKDVLSGDWRKTILFLKGIGLSDKNIHKLDDDYRKAIMIDENIMKDPFIQNNIYQLIKNKINEAKVGVIKVHGNYSIVSGDPYLLCQSIFGLDKTGLLDSGEIYNQYWSSRNVQNLACFRAPMTCHNNVRVVHPNNSNQANYWYKHMPTCTILNAWDTITPALNGCDFDGDLVMLTDNKVLVNKHKELPALFCIQRKAKKIIPTEDDFIRANIESFGNEIGETTNDITTFYEIRAGFPVDSIEYDILTYRIKCGQLYQQNVIDKAKGIVARPMPKSWIDWHAVNKLEYPQDRELYKKLVATKKPYFMRYIYPPLMKQYNTYLKNTEKKCLREFQITVAQLQAIPRDSLTDNQKEFLRYYEYKMPVGMNDCVMNKICRAFEREFDGYIKKNTQDYTFDYSLMKSDCDYTVTQYKQIKKVYEEYNKKLSEYAAFSSSNKINKTESAASLQMFNETFREDCSKICPNQEALCNIVLDICYSKNSTKRFAWNICGDQIISNLLKSNNYTICFPTEDTIGDIHFAGKTFSIKKYITEETE